MFYTKLGIVFLLAIAMVPVMQAQYQPRDNDDSGQYVILSAQYGTAKRHVDVTHRLRELARQDTNFRMGNSTFGVDPDPGQVKTLRIYARGPNGQERMFEYREGSVVNGNLFRSWGRGDWGNGGWSGRWEGNDRDNDRDDRYGRKNDRNDRYGREAQPEMTAAIESLREAQRHLASGSHDKGGHRVRALELVNQAIQETQAGIQFDNTH